MSYSQYVANPPLIYSDSQLSNLEINNFFEVSSTAISTIQCWKQQVRVATTTSGTIDTSFAEGQFVDGILLISGNRILIKDQVTGSENGIYIVTTSTPTRAIDMQSGTNAGSSVLFVNEGTANANKGFICTNPFGSDIVGTNNLTFTSFSGSTLLPGGSTGNLQFNNGGSFGGSSNLTFNNLTNVLTLNGTLTSILPPSSSSDATNKAYVDNAITGLRWKNPVVCATTTNLASLSGLLTVDTITLTAGQRVLVKNQTNGIENGIYVAAAGSWGRASDMALGSDAAAASVYVSQGAVNGTYVYTCTNLTGSAVVGTNSLTFILFNNSGSGDVVGPASANNNALVRFDATTGKLIKNSGVFLSDTQDLTNVRSLGILATSGSTLTISPATTQLADYSLKLPPSQGASGTFLQNDGAGNLTWSSNISAPCFALRHNTSQNLVNNADQIVLFNTSDTEFDNGLTTGITYTPTGFFTNSTSSRITITISYQIVFATNNTGYRYAWVNTNNNTRMAYTTNQAVQNNITNNCGSCTITLAAGAFFRIFAFQTSGATLACGVAQGGLATGFANRIQVTRII